MNILIVESENDQYFIEALVKNFSDETDIFRIDEYRHSSLDEKKLTTQITNALTDISRGVSKIGVILDMDDSTKESRIGLINRCLEKSFSDSGYPKIDALLTETNKFIACQIDDYLTVSISCFFTNVDGKGELETVLKEISSQPSIFADCLYEGWLRCLNDKNKKYGKKGEPCDISDKEILIIDALEVRNVLTLNDVSEIIEQKTVYPVIKLLIEKGIVLIQEELKEKFKPKLESYVRITNYADNEEN